MEKLRHLAAKTFNKWKEDNGITYSAALSFYLIISLPSLLLFSISIGSIFLKEQTLQDAIINYISNVVDEQVINILNLLFKQIPDIDSLTLGVLISFLLLLWSAGNLFRQLKKMIDQMWGISRKGKSWVQNFIDKGITSIAAVLIVVGLLILNTIIEAILFMGSEFLQRILPFSLKIIQYTSSVANFLILVILFMYLYRVLPEIRIDLKYVFVGSFITVVLITLGKYIFGLYLSYSNITTVYGAIGSVLGTFLWIHFSSIIVTFMAEFTKIYSDFEHE